MTHLDDTSYSLVQKKLDDESDIVFSKAVQEALDTGKTQVLAFARGFEALRKKGYVYNEVSSKWEKEKPKVDFAITKIQKTDEDKRLVFGFFNVVEEGGKPVVDHQGHVILEKDLEEAAYHYVKFYRGGDERHDNRTKAVLVESMMFTKEKQDALGIDLGFVGWWGGFHVTDEALWLKIKSGEYQSFSIGGVGNAMRE